MEKNEVTGRMYDDVWVITNEIGEPRIFDTLDFLHYILKKIKNNPNDKELGEELREMYNDCKLTMLFMYDKDIDDEKRYV